MRYVFTICILFVQLVKCFTVVGAAPVQYTLSQKKDAVVTAFSCHHHHAAELARSIHFNCTPVQVRDHRLQEVVPSTDNLCSYIAVALRKRAITDPASSRFPLIRLVLFPNHYFW